MTNKTNAKTQRIDMRVPVGLLKRIEDYQTKMDITNRTTAIMELVRIGLDKAEEKDKKV